MPETHGLICAYLLDGTGSARQIDWSGVREWSPEQGLLWIHLDRTSSIAQDWLTSASGLDSLFCEALLAEETRPRSLASNDGLLAILRGVNLNAGADPEDMVSLRVWLEASRVITLRRWHLMAIEDLRRDLAAGTGPRDAGDFLVAVSTHLIERMAPTLSGLEEETDRLEIELMEPSNQDLRSRLAALRRTAIALRRYIAPQREAMSRLIQEKVSWLGERHRAQLREVADRVTRYVEDLDAVRERAAVTQEEVASRIAAQMNRTMYLLSMVAAVFLPLGLITGLLGINVAGIPGEKNQWAFVTVCIILVGIVVVEVIFFRRRHWL